MITKFNKKDIYEAELKEKIDEIIQLCNRERMPVFISICVKNDDKETQYENDMYSTTSNEIYLKKDLIPRFVNVTNGFRTVPPEREIDIDYD